MAIIKNTPTILKHSGLSFTTIINETMDLIKDPTALGVYLYLASKPKEWEINNLELQRRFGKGRDFVTRHLSYLKKIGLIKVNSIKDEKGRIIYWENTLLNFIQKDNKIEDYPEKPQYWKTSSVENQYLENHTTINKRDIKIKEDIKPPISPVTPESDLATEEPPPHSLTLASPKGECVGKAPTVSTNKPTKRKTADYEQDQDFMAFYNPYPRKKAPKHAYSAWLSLNPNKELQARIIKDVQLRTLNDWNQRPPEKIPYPATYLNRHEWEGDLDVQTLPTSKPKLNFNELDFID